MEPGHLSHIHSVDVIGAEDGDQIRRMALDEPQILEHGVRRSLVPLWALVHLGRDDGNELIRQNRREHPGLVGVFDQRLGLVLHQQVD